MNTGDFDVAPSQSGQTTMNGPTGEDEFDDLGPEQPDDTLADALPAPACCCKVPTLARGVERLWCDTCDRRIAEERYR